MTDESPTPGTRSNDRSAHGTPVPGTAATRPATGPAAKSSGPGRLIITVYAIFALAATARAVFQIATKFGEAPLAYLLSAFAAVVYIVATVSLASRRPGSWRAAVVAVGIELAGVLVVGLLSLLDPASLPHDTVWSGFGRGYGYVPLLLPVLGLWWLHRNRPGRAGTAAQPRG